MPPAYKLRPWLRFAVLDDGQGGGSDKKPTADDLEKLAKSGTGTDTGGEDDKDDKDDKDDGENNPDPDPKDEDEDNDSDDTEWSKAFPDSTPAQVQEEIATWKKRSRDWEKRSKENHAEVERLKANSENDGDDSARVATLEKDNAEISTELGMFRDLVAHAVSSNRSADLPTLLDSVSFRDAYRALDREDDDFQEKLDSLIEQRVGKKPENPKNNHGFSNETYQDHSKSVGEKLYQDLYGDNNN